MFRHLSIAIFPVPSSLSDSSTNPRKALPYLCGASYLRVSPKVKAQADAAEAAALPDMPMRFTCLRSSRLAIRAAEF
jgi:hypothetical protein